MWPEAVTWIVVSTLYGALIRRWGRTTLKLLLPNLCSLKLELKSQAYYSKKIALKESGSFQQGLLRCKSS